MPKPKKQSKPKARRSLAEVTLLATLERLSCAVESLTNYLALNSIPPSNQPAVTHPVGEDIWHVR